MDSCRIPTERVHRSFTLAFMTTRTRKRLIAPSSFDYLFTQLEPMRRIRLAPVPVFVITGMFAVLISVASFIGAREVAHHSQDHLIEAQDGLATTVQAGLEAITSDIRAVATFTAHTEMLDQDRFGRFVADVKSQGLCAESILGIGLVSSSSDDDEGFYMGPLDIETLNSIKASAQFDSGVAELATSDVSYYAVPIADFKDDMVVFLTKVDINEPNSRVVFSIHDSDLLTDSLVPANSGVHGVEAIAMEIVHVFTGQLVGSDSFDQSDSADVRLTVPPSKFEASGTEWSVRLLAPGDFAQLRSDKSVIPAIVVSGLALMTITIGIYYIVYRPTELLRNRAVKAEADYQTELAVNSRLETSVDLVMQSASEGILLVDQHRRIIWINDSFRDLFGIGDDVWVGRSSTELEHTMDSVLNSFDSEFHQNVDDIYSDTNRRLHGEVFQIPGVAGDRFVSRSTVPVSRTDGQYLGRLWIYSGVTEMQKISDARSNLVSHVSHELRTPLPTVMGHVYLLADGLLGELSDDQNRSVNAASSALHRLGTILDDLLDVSRIETGNLEVFFDQVSGVDLISKIVKEFELKFRSSGIGLTFNSIGDDPVWLDAVRYGQVVTNLLSNAARYTDAGGRVDVLVRSTENSIELQVTDTGIGIPSDKLDAVFEPFSSAQNLPSRKQGSTGLGLAVSKGLVELHNGTITVTSKKGTGSQFTVTVPAVQSDWIRLA